MHLNGGPCPEVDGDRHKRDGADQVCPYVTGLGVYAKDGLEAGLDGGQGRSMALQEEVVVAEPVGQSVMRHGLPPALPHILGKELDLLGAILRHVEQVDGHC